MASFGKRKSPSSPLVLSAGVVPVFFENEKPLYLLLRIYRYWDFPKGVVEAGESAFEGAVRELEEETGITQVDFPWGKDFLETEPYSYGKVARYYLARIGSKHVYLPANPTTAQTEHDEYRWLSYEEARKLLVPRVKVVLDWAHAKVEPKPRQIAEERTVG